MDIEKERGWEKRGGGDVTEEKRGGWSYERMTKAF